MSTKHCLLWGLLLRNEDVNDLESQTLAELVLVEARLDVLLQLDLAITVRVHLVHAVCGDHLLSCLQHVV